MELDWVFEVSRQVRYAAHGEGQQISTRVRENVANASGADSDFYEELLVNPTLLALARQRGDLDCGGLRYLIVGYGNFSQIVIPLDRGHLSVCVEREADAPRIAEKLLVRLDARRD